MKTFIVKLNNTQIEIKQDDDGKFIIPEHLRGMGTALKPAAEFWWLVRKPLDKGLNISENVLKHGCGGLNIDASRIEAVDSEALAKHWDRTQSETMALDRPAYGKFGAIDLRDRVPAGRFPANLVLSHFEGCVEVGVKKVKSDGHHANKTIGFGEREYNGPGRRDGTETVAAWNCPEGCPIRELDRQSGVLKSGGKQNASYSNQNDGMFTPGGQQVSSFYGSSGGASRFFKTFEPEISALFLYCAKASKREKNTGLEDLPLKESGTKNASGRGFSESDPYKKVLNQNGHPTVKATKLMSYLIRLITPPDGICLDPFMGSGSTGVAAIQSGFHFIGVEQSEEYLEIARKRIEHAQKQAKKEKKA